MLRNISYIVLLIYMTNFNRKFFKSKRSSEWSAKLKVIWSRLQLTFQLCKTNKLRIFYVFTKKYTPLLRYG